MDRDLVEQARRGDREAFAVLVHQVSDSLYAVAQRILRDSALAEDALQNALVLAWRRIPHLREPDRFEAWIHRILVHACYDESQRARQWTANVRVLPVDGPTTPDGSAVIADRDELERAFRRLPIDQRAVFVLHHYLGLPLVEIAQMLEIPAGTARSRLHYATRGLRDALTGRCGARCPRRTSRMTDDRSLERAARSWLENGPTEAPDRAVEAALLRIETTPQERDLRIPWRLPKMTTPARVAAAAVIGVLAVGGAFFMLGETRSVSGRRAWPDVDPDRIADSYPLGDGRSDRPSRRGPLVAGRHMAMPFAPPYGNGVCHDPPQPGCSDTARDDTIRFTFTVPDGWASNDSGAAITKPATGIVAPTGMALLFHRGGWLYSDPCINVATQELPDIPVGPSVDDFANALADHPLLDATTPTSITLGGYSGKYVDLQLPSDSPALRALPLGALDACSGTKPQMASLDPRCRRHLASWCRPRTSRALLSQTWPSNRRS